MKYEFRSEEEFKRTLKRSHDTLVYIKNLFLERNTLYAILKERIETLSKMNDTLKADISSRLESLPTKLLVMLEIKREIGQDFRRYQLMTITKSKILSQMAEKRSRIDYTTQRENIKDVIDMIRKTWNSLG